MSRLVLPRPIMSSLFSLCTWNVRGLGEPNKCTDVRANIEAMQPSFLALQETKLDGPPPAKMNSFLPPSLRTFLTIDSVGASGGICSAWNGRVFTLSNHTATAHALSVDLTLSHDNSVVRITNVYAPCDHAAKEAFLVELSGHAPPCSTPWSILGDFNLIRSPDDRNNDNFSRVEALWFNDFINDLALIDLPLRDRQFTWSNRQSSPILARLDRVLVNTAWDSAFPTSKLASFTRSVSDHVPLVASHLLPGSENAHFSIRNILDAPLLFSLFHPLCMGVRVPGRCRGSSRCASAPMPP